MKVNKEIIIDGFISLGLGIFGSKVMSSWFSEVPELIDWGSMPIFGAVSYGLISYLKKNKQEITNELKKMFLEFDMSEEDKKIMERDNEARKQNKQAVLDFYDEEEEYSQNIKALFKTTPGSLPCIVNFLNFMDEKYSSEIIEHCDISHKDLIVEILTAIIGCGYNGEAVEFDASKVQEILIELPYDLNWNYAKRIEKQFSKETMDIDFESEDCYFEDSEKELYDIFDLEYYDSMFQQHIERGNFAQIGTFKYRQEDLEFMRDVFHLMLDMFGDQILFEEDKKQEIDQLAYDYAYCAGCYAALNGREFVDKQALLGCFKGWEGALNHTQKMELFDAVCEQYGYEYHPYKKISSVTPQKCNIIQFPTTIK